MGVEKGGEKENRLQQILRTCKRRICIGLGTRRKASSVCSTSLARAMKWDKEGGGGGGGGQLSRDVHI